MMRGVPSAESESSTPSADARSHDADSESESAGRPSATPYEERTKQVYEARGALAEAVAALTVELSQRRAEAGSLRDERDRAAGDIRALRAELEAQHERIADLEQVVHDARDAVTALQNMKVMRWSEPVRRIVYRLRARRG
jgi:chromosome segregation ATPase